MDKKTILLVEDNVSERYLLRAFLPADKFTFIEAESSEETLKLIRSEKVDLILLDLNLPDAKGTELIDRLRLIFEGPIIAVSGNQTDQDIIAGLTAGADDYVCKPYNPHELILRMTKLLERFGVVNKLTTELYHFNQFHLNVEKHRLTGPNFESIDLTSGELSILIALLRAKGRVVPREQLFSMIMKNGESSNDRTVDMLVSRLRKKLEDSPRKPKIILTVKGLGYQILQVGEE